MRPASRSRARSASGSAPAPTEPLTEVTVPVAGMTCRTCERRIERQIRRIPNVDEVSASAAHGNVRVVSRGPVWPALLEAGIRAAGYEVGRDPWLSHDLRTWLAAGAGVVFLVVAVAVARVTGLERVLGGTGDIAEGGLVVALLLGMAAGVSTCLALTGGLVLALSAAFVAARDPGSEPGALARLRPTAVFVAGRIAGFAVLGALLGAVGASFTMPPTLVALLMIAVAVLMAIVGTRLTGLSPRIAAWSPTLPAGLGRAVGADESAVTRYSDTRAVALGVATFFLPCGFTQAVQVYALSTGSPVMAGAIMAVFALGTAPGLFALGGLPNLLPTSIRPTALRVIGVVVLGFALLNVTSGLRILGLSPSLPGAQAAVAPEVTLQDGIQTVRTYQDADGYRPETVALYAGVPTRWVIESLEGRSCAIFLQVPRLGIAVRLAEGENVIDLPALDQGTIAYSCSMGMYGGQLQVVAPPTGQAAGPLGG